jgi:hypothetical protein
MSGGSTNSGSKPKMDTATQIAWLIYASKGEEILSCHAFLGKANVSRQVITAFWRDVSPDRLFTRSIA